jgi:hypothetical protein
VAGGDVVDMGHGQPARGQGREPAPDRVAEQVVDARCGPRARPVDAGRVDDHDLEALARLGQDQLLRVLLGALVRGALGIVGEPGFVERAAGLGVEDVEGGGVHRPLRARLARRDDDVGGPLRVDPVEEALVGEPLLVDPHAVEDAVDPLGSGVDAGGIGDVAPGQLDPGGQQPAGGGHVTDQRDHLVAALGEPAGDRVTDLAGGAGDEEPHAAQRICRHRGGRIAIIAPP